MSIIINEFEAIILDFDGVILDSEPIHFEAYCKTLEELNIHLTYDFYHKNYLGLSDKDLIPKLLHDFNWQESVNTEELIHKKINHYTEVLSNKNNLNPINGLIPFINSITSDKKLAICSGAIHSEILCGIQKLEPLLNSSQFKEIISADHVETGKPSPEGYLLTAQKLNLSPHQCLVVEDSPHGIKAAKSAGMTVIALLTTHNPSQLHEADYITTDFTTLLCECV